MITNFATLDALIDWAIKVQGKGHAEECTAPHRKTTAYVVAVDPSTSPGRVRVWHPVYRHECEATWSTVDELRNAIDDLVNQVRRLRRREIHLTQKAEREQPTRDWRQEVVLQRLEAATATARQTQAEFRAAKAAGATRAKTKSLSIRRRAAHDERNELIIEAASCGLTASQISLRTGLSLPTVSLVIQARARQQARG